MKVLSIVGRLGRDAELRHTNGGEAVLNLNVAVDDRKKVGGEWKNETMWIGVTLFGKRAESLAKLCTKGARIAATGDLNMRTYETKGGETRTSVELFARDVEPLLASRNDGAGQQSRQGEGGRQPAGWQGGNGGPSYSNEDAGNGSFAGDDDIPF